ncbi:MAG: pitrilysin family protein [Bacteroidota bacterium]
MTKKNYKSSPKEIIGEPNISKGNYCKTTLPNGIRIISENVNSIESFALGVCINAGSREDLPEYNGTAHFIEHMLFRRTKNKSYKQIATAFESLGAYYNAFTTKEFTYLYVRALKSNFSKVFNLLTEIALFPVFSDSDFANEKAIIMEEISIIDDDPEELIFDYGDKLIFGNHSLSYPIIGTKLSLDSMNSVVLSDYHKKYYNSKNMIIAVAGNISHEEILNCVNSSPLATMKSKGMQVHRSHSPNTFTLKQEIKKQFQQSHILLGRKTEGLNHEDKYPLSIINILFGDGTSSRLYQNLREKHGLAYNVYSSLILMSDCGEFYIYAATDTKKLDKVEKMIRDEIINLLDKKITKEEISRAKEQLKASTIMELESMSSRMQILGRNELLSGTYEDTPSIIRDIDSITTHRIRAIAQKYFLLEDWSTVIFRP